MNDGAPPTLLDRLTRMNRDEASRGSSAARPPVLDDFLDADLTRARNDSRRSHAGGSFEETRATDFAITTVNVPDRLDMREVRDQAEEEYKRPGFFSFDRYLLGLWIKRIVWITVLALASFWGYEFLRPIQQDLSAASIARRLTASTGTPVQVADTAFRFSPSPRFVLVGVTLGDVKFDEVGIRFNWQDAWSAIRGGSWSWGEAVVSPTQLTAQQTWSLLARAQSLTTALPTSMSVLRFSSVQVVDAPLMAEPVEVVVRRGSDGRFGPVSVGATGAASNYRLTLTPVPQLEGPRLAFQFDANDWRPPGGFRLGWSEAVANGFVSPSLLEVESFSLAGSYGVLQGAYYLATDQYWVATGYARGTGIDVEAVIGALARRSAERIPAGETPPRAAFSGTATTTLALGGQGESAAAAVQKAAFAGPVQVRWAAINGINLGYAATHGGGDRGLGGGLTRFSELDASLIALPDSIVLKDIVARAGAMLTRGEVSVATDQALTGAVRVDLGASRVQAPINLRVRGTLNEPRFVR